MIIIGLQYIYCDIYNQGNTLNEKVVKKQRLIWKKRNYATFNINIYFVESKKFQHKKTQMTTLK